VATLALHHFPTARAKQAFYRTCFRAPRAAGVLATGDAFLADDPALTRRFTATWVAHMSQFYSARRAGAFLRSWAGEDRYFSLGAELAMLQAAGFYTEILWRRPPFGALLGLKRV
jgi:hypothetical protein